MGCIYYTKRIKITLKKIIAKVETFIKFKKKDFSVNLFSKLYEKVIKFIAFQMYFCVLFELLLGKLIKFPFFTGILLKYSVTSPLIIIKSIFH